MPEFSLTPISKSIVSTVAFAPSKRRLTAVDDGGGHENTRTAAKSAHEVGNNREETEDSTTEGSSSGDDTLELLVDRGVTVAGKSHALVLELPGDIAGSRAGNLDPGLGEDGTGSDDECDVNDGVKRVNERSLERVGCRDVVRDARDSRELRRTLVQGLPDTEELDKEVVGEARRKHLGDEEDVRGEGALEHDGHVRGVEQLDGVGTALAAHLGRLDRNLDSETLEVDDGGEDGDGGQQVHDVGETVTVEGLLESARLVVPGEEQVEEGDKGTLELWAATGVDGVGGESLPDDVLANVGSDEKGDTAAETVALGEQLVEEDNDERGRDKLENEEKADTGAERRGRAVHAGEDVDSSLAKRDDESEDWCKWGRTKTLR